MRSEDEHDEHDAGEDGGQHLAGVVQYLAVLAVRYGEYACVLDDGCAAEGRELRQ